ncbi:MAG: hypothetical protein HZC54_17545 [Verrucomicrobia bacterium]|nr:hypothetical protein [Verrucomicrobiota bacterium]
MSLPPLSVVAPQEKQLLPDAVEVAEGADENLAAADGGGGGFFLWRAA